MKEEVQKKIGSDDINPDYIRFRLAKALTTAFDHEDADTRSRALEKVSKWQTVFDGLVSGQLDVGSRTPIKDVPEWATPEVVTGGFVTGELLAGGPVRGHERAMLTAISREESSTPRYDLNTYFLTDEGLKHLISMMRSGNYKVTVPEEGALLVVAWLTEMGYPEHARNLLLEIAPYFSSLRFYPVNTDRPVVTGSRVFLQDIGTTIKNLRRIRPQEQILKQKESIDIWTPFYEKMIGLFLETVEGEHPYLQTDANGKWTLDAEGRFPVAGGWPCRKFPEDWRTRADALLEEYRKLRAVHTLCGKPERSEKAFAQLRGYLVRCVDDPALLTGCDVGRIRLILARHLTKYGEPESERYKEFRTLQLKQIADPLYNEIAMVIIRRLETFSNDTGLDSVDSVIYPVTSGEAEKFSIKQATGVPDTIVKKVSRSVSDSIDSLVEKELIPSGDTLAEVLPQVTSEIEAMGIPDVRLRQIYAAIYRAFRRRRSLLLLNLESQVKISELPWIKAIESFRNDDLSAREVSQQTLEEITVLTLSSFPYAIIPNKLLTELKALAKGADLKLPLLEELAADIFMGEFSPKYFAAAKIAADLLQGTLYERYYGIDYGLIRELPEPDKSMRRWFRSSPPDMLAELCASMAGVSLRTWSVAKRGAIIEQQQVITTQNLAVLYSGLNLADILKNQLFALAQKCFLRVCKLLQANAPDRHSHLIAVKNSAYAWRQMIFYLALLSDTDLQGFLSWSHQHLQNQREDLRGRIHPFLLGLQMVAAGHSFDSEYVTGSGAYRFLGWNTYDKIW